MAKRVEIEAVLGFVREFYGGQYPSQRVGQAFVNRFLLLTKPAHHGYSAEVSALFYEENPKAALKAIFNDFMERRNESPVRP